MDNTYTSTDFIGAVVYYLAKNDIHKVQTEKIIEVKTLFMYEAANNGKQRFIYCDKSDVIDFSEKTSNVWYDYREERIIISEDYDFAVKTDCKKYAKKFKKSKDWDALKKILKKEFYIH